MSRGVDDVVRPYQLPSNSPGELYLSQYNLASNAPIYITPGMGGAAGSQLPPLITGSAHYDITVTHYCAQASVEVGQGGG